MRVGVDDKRDEPVDLVDYARTLHFTLVVGLDFIYFFSIALHGVKVVPRRCPTPLSSRQLAQLTSRRDWFEQSASQTQAFQAG